MLSRFQRITLVEFIQVSTTTNSYASASKIAGALVQTKSAACVQILGPVKSIYRWKGRVEHATEWLCLIKARADDYRLIEGTIRDLHDYKIPEVVALPILKGSSDYLTWMRSETRRRKRSST